MGFSHGFNLLMWITNRSEMEQEQQKVRPKEVAETHASKKNMEFLLVNAPENPFSSLSMYQQCWSHQLLSTAMSLSDKQGARCLCSICMRDMCFPCQYFNYHPAAASCQVQNMVSTILTPCSYLTSFVLASSLLTCRGGGCVTVQYSHACHIFWIIFEHHFS